MFQVSVWSEKAAPKDYATLAPLVFSLADKGDAVALKIRGDGAAAISRLACALHKHGIGRLCLLGGLSRFYANLLDPDVRALLQPPQADALDGAILMAGGAFRS